MRDGEDEVLLNNMDIGKKTVNAGIIVLSAFLLLTNIGDTTIQGIRGEPSCTPISGKDWTINISHNCILTGGDWTVGNITFYGTEIGGVLWLNNSNITFESLTIPASGVETRITSGMQTYIVNKDGILEDRIITYPSTDSIETGEYIIDIDPRYDWFIVGVVCTCCYGDSLPSNITISKLDRNRMEFNISVNDTSRAILVNITGPRPNTDSFAYLDDTPWIVRCYFGPMMGPLSNYTSGNNATVDSNGNFYHRLDMTYKSQTYLKLLLRDGVSMPDVKTVDVMYT